MNNGWTRTLESLSLDRQQVMFVETQGQADNPSMFDGLAQWKPVMEKLVEQGLPAPSILWKP